VLNNNRNRVNWKILIFFLIQVVRRHNCMLRRKDTAPTVGFVCVMITNLLWFCFSVLCGKTLKMRMVSELKRKKFEYADVCFLMRYL